MPKLSKRLGVAMQLQAEYMEFADSKNHEAAGNLLKYATVSFDGVEISDNQLIKNHYQKMWSAPEAHRHMASNFRIVRSTRNKFVAEANYQRWVFGESVRMTTLGRYRTSFIRVSGKWVISRLEVTRQFHQA